MTAGGNHSAAHHALVRAVLARLGRRTDLRIFDNPRGFDARSKAFYGLCPGASDLLAIAKPRGRWLALEVKTGVAVLTTEQAAFLEMIRNFGGVGQVVRCVDEAERAADEACR